MGVENLLTYNNSCSSNPIIYPTMSITSSTVDNDDISNDASITLTFISSVPTVNFVESHITVTNGVISNFAGSETTYTATFTPSTSGITKIKIDADKYTDNIGNNNLVSNEFNWTYDNIEPTMTIISNTVDNNFTSSDSSIGLIFTSTRATNNFNVDDITVTNGTLSNFAGSETTYSATFTPSVEGETTINVVAGVYTDSIGNNNQASNVFNWTFN